MEEKPAELPISEQEVQIPSPSFLDKLKIHKLKILGGILGILVFTGAVFGAYKLGQKSIYPEPGEGPTPTPTQEVTITTDKLEYGQGETIKITVRNGLDTKILYYRSGEFGRFWGIEYLEDGKWKNPDYEEGGGFQLTEKNINDACDILLYERMPPIELEVNSTVSQQWNQRICPFGEENPSKPRFVKYIGAGHYRLIFYYGFEISSEDPYKIKDGKTVYSNELRIRFLEESSQPQVSVPQPVGLARQDLAERLGLSTSSVEILEIEEALWPDTCLGLPAPELCARGETPGYRVTMMALGQKYTYHTDTSESFRYAGPGDTPQRP